MLIYILVIGCAFLIFEFIFSGNSSSLALHAIPILLGFAIVIYSIQNNIIQSLEKKISKIEIENNDLEIKLKSSDILEHYNSITGLPTFIFQKDRITMAIKWANRKGGHIAVYRIQVGSYVSTESVFEELSDKEAITQKADQMKRMLRDNISLLHTGRTDFLILAESISDVKDILAIKQKLETTLATPILMKNGSTATGIDKLAMAVYPFDGKDADSLIAVAENNLNMDCYMSDICRSNMQLPLADHRDSHPAKNGAPKSGQPQPMG